MTTIEVDTYRGTKRVTKAEYVKLWVDAAQQFLNIGLDIRELAEQKASAMFDEKASHD
jgi:hypothetical protein